MTSILKLLHRSFLVCEATMQDSLSTDFTGVPIVKVKVVNQSSGEQIVLDPFEFVKAHTVLNDEVAFIKGALAAHNDYVAPDYHEPVTLLFDHSFQLGTAIFFIEYLIYLFPSEDEDTEQAISNVGGFKQFDIKYARMMPVANIGGIDIWTKNLPANETAMEQTLAPNNPTMSRFIAPNGMTKVIKASAAEKRLSKCKLVKFRKV